MPPKQVQETYEIGQTVFFKHPKHCWVVGQVVSEEKGIHTCKTNDPVRTETKKDEVIEKLAGTTDIAPCQMDILDEMVNDLLSLTILHDSTLLRCLYLRYMSDIIYTNIGAIVVALNPFNFKIPRYMDDMMPKYLAEGHQIQQNLPHSWAQAHNTYWEMVDEQYNQCVLISGESGAGKTEATKIVMKYLAQISCKGASDSEREKGLLVGTKLNMCSPILEAFGNAKTVRNDNSSRFGKFMRVKFDQDNRLSGAFTTKYLLEKSRIITAALNERIYHSFYIVVRGKYKSFLSLENEKNYKSINSGKCLENKEFSSAEDFDEVCQAMSGVGMKENEIRSVWKIPAGVMSLQNVNLLQDGTEGSMIDDATVSYLKHVATLWDIDLEVLKRELMTSTLPLPGNSFTVKPNKLTAAFDIRDALCKHSYDGIFAWLVDKCNEMCDTEADGNWIGLLDIFGFEDFEKNSFEQLCINLTNETLQNHYNNYIFTKDMEECKAEGIDVADIICPDNEPCLQMISNPRGGIMSLLDEECLLGQSTDISFLEKIVGAHDKSPFFFKKKSSRDTFGIHHYAASVTYDINGWLDKNRDNLKDAIKTMMRKSADSLVSIVLPEPIPADQKKGKGYTVGGFFADQVRTLLEVINSTNPHWIRCIKPHPAKKPKNFDGVQSMNQLESSGVLGTVKIRKAGYPIRLPLDKFVRRYRCIAPSDGDEKSIINEAVTNAEINDKKFYQLGTTKVFLKSEAYQKLEKLREAAVVKWVLELQRIGRGYNGRHRLFKMYCEKHRSALLAAKKEKEERERAEKEAAEKAKREAEEAERRRIEAEERKRREAERAAQLRLERAAICLQRHTRGGLCRIRLLRRFIEEERSKFEAMVEAAACEDRMSLMNADALRIKSERTWVAYLNNIDEIANLKSSEKSREKKNLEQKLRIQRREFMHRYHDARAEVEAEEDSAFQTLIARCRIIAEHKKELEASRAKQVQESGSHRRASPMNKTKPGDKVRITAGGAIVNDEEVQRKNTDPRQAAARDQMLAQYALNRARAFESYFPQQPPPARDSYRQRSQMNADPAMNPLANSQRRTNSAGVSARPKPMTPQMSRQLFERSKNEWERQEEYLQYRQQPAARSARMSNPLASGGGGLAESSGMTNTANDFSGPFRTNDAAIRSSNNLNGGASTASGSVLRGNSSHHHQATTPLAVPHNTSSAASTGNNNYTAPRFNTPGATSAGNTTGMPSAAALRTHQSPSHARAERDFKNAANWETVFQNQMY